MDLDLQEYLPTTPPKSQFFQKNLGGTPHPLIEFYKQKYEI